MIYPALQRSVDSLFQTEPRPMTDAVVTGNLSSMRTPISLRIVALLTLKPPELATALEETGIAVEI